ncbi:PAS domain-containing protein [Chondromyces crocatus]|uniref:Anti-anti-sigma factor n=1 Tax=Chondromyces crocatus TaxID=52 RepID=A0A0K1EM79_CHOCO|nr:PAS domain-containing protein [Chondromyces crocatus]AKT41723.1 uncharacterized protein CMC5_059340 [Chondromyces crocatus]
MKPATTTDPHRDDPKNPRARLAELEQSEHALKQELERMQRIVGSLPQNIYLYNIQENRSVYANNNLGRLLGNSPNELVDMGSALLTTIIHPDDWDPYRQYAQQFATLEDGQLLKLDWRARRQNGEYHWIRSFEQVFSRDDSGAVEVVLGIVHDLTEELRADAERAALREQIIAAQSAALREIGTPLIPISEGVVAMPLVGAIDDDRAARILEVLLEGISERRARIAILDVTGVKEMDDRIADALCKVARAASLLGAKVVLTGIQPSTARALVTLGVNTSHLTTRATLQEAIADALVRPSR